MKNLKRQRILNLYCGIGGNRKLWGNKHEITAVEINPKIAKIYKDFFPEDNVIVGDAHEYLRANFRNFDFIWTSPPCPTHSELQMTRFYDTDLRYPDMALYQEIILLKYFYKGNWVVENVNPYYKPLINPAFKIERHLFWSNKFFLTENLNLGLFDDIRSNIKNMQKKYGFNLNPYKKDLSCFEIRKCLRNCVIPELGKYVFEKIQEVTDDKRRI